MASFNPCRRGQPAPTFVNETHARSPSAPSKGWATTAIVVGSLAVIVLGAIGTAGFLHSSGIISSFPNSFSWIANVGTIGHGVMLGGAGLGIVAIAVGGTKCHQARMAEKAQVRRGGERTGEIGNFRKAEGQLTLKPQAVLEGSKSYYANIVRQGQYVISNFTGNWTHANINVLNESGDGFTYYSVLNADVDRAIAQLGLIEKVAFIPEIEKAASDA